MLDTSWSGGHRFPRTAKTIQAVCLSCPEELESETLTLKAAHMLVTDIEKLSWYWPEHFLSAGAISQSWKVLYKLLVEKKSSVVLSRCDPMTDNNDKPNKMCPYVCDNGMNVLWVSNNFLITFKMSFTGRKNSCLILYLVNNPWLDISYALGISPLLLFASPKYNKMLFKHASIFP